MSTKITIQNTQIDFPTSGESPNWGPAIVQFALAVENALNATIGPYDVAPQIQVIDSNSVSNLPITNLTFPPVDVSQVVIDYSVQRKITDGGVDKIYTEGGILTCTYRPENSMWDWTQSKTGSASCEFNIQQSGQVEITFHPLTGDSATHTGMVSFRARALLSHD